MASVQMRDIKDFLLLYNQISETCFKKCTHVISRGISAEEELCINNCAQKHIHTNHKVTETFMEVQPVLVRKRVEEVENMQANVEVENVQPNVEVESVQANVEVDNIQATAEVQTQNHQDVV